MEGRGVRIERIADHKLREAVFRRRKNGLLRRAMELSVMADCDVAVLVFHGSSGALTQYSSSPIGGMLQRFARACGKPHETYTNEDLYSHHVLAQLAADADEAAGASAKRTRTLPSFWAAKAALERQQRQPNGWHAGGGGGGQGEGVGAAPREGKRRRTEEGQQAGGEEGRKAASPSPSDFSDLDRQAAALAELAEGEACPLTPRSSLAYQRIAREFDRLVARAREEMETAEALAAVAEEDGEEEQEGAADEEGGAAEEAVAAGGGSTPAGHIAAGTPAAGEAAAATPTTEEGEGPAADVAGDGDVEMTEAAGAAAAVHAPAVEPPASPPPPLAESPGSREVEHPTPSLSALPLSAGQPDQQNTPSTPAPAGVPAAADAALAPSRPSTNGALPSLSAAAGPGSGHQQPQLQQLQQLHQFQQQQQQQQQQQALQLPAGVVRGTAVGPSPRATLPAGAPHLVLPPGMQLPKGALAQLPAAARMQLGALPRGGGYVLRPVAVPMVGGAAGGGGGAGQQQQGMMLQLQPVAMQPGQLQQYQRLLLQQQQQLAAMHAAATKAAHLNAAAAVAQQQQQQPAQASQPGQPQQQSAGDEVVLPIVSQPHVQLPQEQQRPQPGHDAVADMLA